MNGLRMEAFNKALLCNKSTLASCKSGASRVLECTGASNAIDCVVMTQNCINPPTSSEGESEKPVNQPQQVDEIVTDKSVSLQNMANGQVQKLTPYKETKRRNSAISVGQNLMKQVQSNCRTLVNKSGGEIQFPLQVNRIQHLLESRKVCQSEVFYFLTTTRTILHSELCEMLTKFVKLKKICGYEVEKSVYKDFDRRRLLTRLFQKRAHVFNNANDSYVLRDGRVGQGGFENIGKPSETWPLVMTDYLSYDEMKVASLLALSSPSAFINEGSKTNGGIPVKNLRSFQIRGLVIAVSPPRFDKSFVMEYADIVIDKGQNLAENGYGVDSELQKPLARLWAKFYQVERFPTFEQVSNLNETDLNENYLFLPDERYFNLTMYKKRMQVTAEIILLEANFRCWEINRPAYIHMPSLGLDNWPFNNKDDSWKEPRKTLLLAYFQSFGQALSRLRLSNVGVIAFSAENLEDDNQDELLETVKVDARNTSIKIEFSDRNPCDKLPHEFYKHHLVVVYPANCNSLPGNQYWIGSLEASIEQSLACCSMISELHNGAVNRAINGDNTVVLDPEYDNI